MFWHIKDKTNIGTVKEVSVSTVHHLFWNKLTSELVVHLLHTTQRRRQEHSISVFSNFSRVVDAVPLTKEDLASLMFNHAHDKLGMRVRSSLSLRRFGDDCPSDCDFLGRAASCPLLRSNIGAFLKARLIWIAFIWITMLDGVLQYPTVAREMFLRSGTFLATTNRCKGVLHLPAKSYQ